MLVESLPMTCPGKPAGDRPDDSARTPRRRREGSRALLAAALLAAVAAAFLAGGFAADALCALLDIASPRLRLAVRILSVVLALPAAFFLVERAFLKRTSRP